MNPLQKLVNGLDKIIPGGFSNIFNFSLQIGLLLAFGVIVHAGIIYMTAGDKADKITEAKQRIISAFVGLLIIAGAYTLLNIVNPKIFLIK